MDNLTMWTLIVGFLLPTVIAVVQRPTFSKRVRTVITASFCAVGGAGTAFFNDEFVARDIVTSILIVGVSTITFYNGFWKTTGITPAIEAKTSPDSEGGTSNPVGILVVAILAVVLIYLLLGLR